MLDARRRFRLETLGFTLLMLSLGAIAHEYRWFRTLDFAFYDTLVRNFPGPGVDDIVIVGIDEQSLASYGPWPWSRQQQAQLLSAIAQGQPRATFLDIVYGSSTTRAEDRALTQAAAQLNPLALPVIIDAIAANRQLVEVLPLPSLLEQSPVLGHAHVELDHDAVTRGIYLYQGIGDAHWPHVTLALAQALGFAETAGSPCTTEGFSLQNNKCVFRSVRFAGEAGWFLPSLSARHLGGQPAGFAAR